MQDELGLVIDEPIEGHYYWILASSPRAGGAPVVVDFSLGPLPTPKTAIDAGAAAMRCHRGLRRGPNGPYSEFRAEWYADTVPMPLA